MLKKTIAALALIAATLVGSPVSDAGAATACSHGWTDPDLNEFRLFYTSRTAGHVPAWDYQQCGGYTYGYPGTGTTWFGTWACGGSELPIDYTGFSPGGGYKSLGGPSSGDFCTRIAAGSGSTATNFSGRLDYS
ncbi:MAG: hypothetical protein AAGD18_17465 [Actinomycetota bacterium]